MSFWDGSRWVPETDLAPRAGAKHQRLTAWLATVAMLVVAVGAAIPRDMVNANSPTLTTNPTTAIAGARITVMGAGFSVGSSLRVIFDGQVVLATPRVDRTGGFKARVRIPQADPGRHVIEAVQAAGTTGVLATAILTIESEAAPSSTDAPATPAVAPTAAATDSPTATPAPTASPMPIASETPASETPSSSAAPSSSTVTPTPTPTASPTATSTLSPTPVPTPTPTAAPVAETGIYYVSTSGDDSASGSSSAPWRTIGHAVSSAPSESVIRVRAGTYDAFSVSRSGLVIEAVSGDVVTVSGGTTAITVTARNTVLRHLRVTGASGQGVRVADTADVSLIGLIVEDNAGHGINIIRTARPIVADSVVRSNRMSGIRELDGTVDGRYTGNTVADNGHDGAAYNGDGILLQGVGGLVRGNTIVRNGDSNMYEHGVYAAAVASGYRIENNVIRDNSASGIKAGGAGRVTGNTVSGSVRGLVFAGTGGSVVVNGNSVDAGTYAVLVTSDCDIARFASDENSFSLKRFGYAGQSLDLAGWQTSTGLDLHSN